MKQTGVVVGEQEEIKPNNLYAYLHSPWKQTRLLKVKMGWGLGDGEESVGNGGHL